MCQTLFFSRVSHQETETTIFGFMLFFIHHYFYQVSRDGRSPVHEEHDYHAEQSCEERKPRTVVAEGRSPVGSLRDARVEHGEVYQGERGHEEV
jgi:hypothetical protein